MYIPILMYAVYSRPIQKHWLYYVWTLNTFVIVLPSPVSLLKNLQVQCHCLTPLYASPGAVICLLPTSPCPAGWIYLWHGRAPLRLPLTTLPLLYVIDTGSMLPSRRLWASFEQWCYYSIICQGLKLGPGASLSPRPYYTRMSYFVKTLLKLKVNTALVITCEVLKCHQAAYGCLDNHTRWSMSPAGFKPLLVTDLNLKIIYRNRGNLLCPERGLSMWMVCVNSGWRG